jgi:hypothetical protein
MRVMVLHADRKVFPVIVRDDIFPHVAVVPATSDTYVFFEREIVVVFGVERSTRRFEV